MYGKEFRIENGLAYGNYGLLGFDSDYTLNNNFLNYEIKNFKDRQDIAQIEKLFPYQAVYIKTGGPDKNRGTVIEFVTINGVTPKDGVDSCYWNYSITRSYDIKDICSARSLFNINQVYERNIYILTHRYNEVSAKNTKLTIENEFAKTLFKGITINTCDKTKE